MPNKIPVRSSDEIRFETLSPETVEQMAISAPRYTSYPTADRFRSDFSPIDYLQGAFRATRQIEEKKPLSIYVHIPFCQQICFYCACNKISPQSPAQINAYLDRLIADIGYQAALFRNSHHVEAIHFGGGSPTLLTDKQLEKIVETLTRQFTVASDKKISQSIEIDPRSVRPERFKALVTLGFDRCSFGVQDSNETVQTAIGRRQPERLVTKAIEAARDAGISAVSLDMICGLPHQTLESCKETLKRLLTWNPDSVSFFNYAHLPNRFTVQQRIDEKALPSPTARLAMMRMIIKTMTRAGYHHIGLDHFAKPNTALAKAQTNGTLYRNFQGYSSGQASDLVGIGLSAISQIDDCYAQNQSNIEAYFSAIETTGSATYRGIRLSLDDQIRRSAIQAIMCYRRLDYTDIETRYGIDANAYFSEAIDKLVPLEELGLLVREDKGFSVTDVGRPFLRHAAMVFDRYFGSLPTQARYSSTL